MHACVCMCIGTYVYTCACSGPKSMSNVFLTVFIETGFLIESSTHQFCLTPCPVILSLPFKYCNYKCHHACPANMWNLNLGLQACMLNAVSAEPSHSLYY